MPIKIRAHHLLCMQGFQGFGYSEEFTANMARIINALKSNPQQLIEIITTTDAICSCCPHAQHDACQKTFDANNKICTLDELILNKLTLPTNVILQFAEVNKIIAKKLNKRAINEICGDCSWQKQCLYFQKLVTADNLTAKTTNNQKNTR